VRATPRNPSSSAIIALPGEVVATNLDGKSCVASVGASGGFTLVSMPGSYDIVGMSPKFRVDMGTGFHEGTCRPSPARIVVESGSLRSVFVQCFEK
jgi:hypothetical protein